MIAYTHDMPGGAGYTLVVPRGWGLTLSCLGDGACASMLAYPVDQPLERLNVPDTLKAQMSMCVRPPMVLMSDMGRALCSVTGSSLDWHDAISGHSLATHVDRYGESDYARHRNDWRRAGRELLLDELYKQGLGERDLHATVNWFAKVAPDERGGLSYATGHAREGDTVALRAELDLLLILTTAPHPLDPSPAWAPAAVRLDVAPAADNEASRAFRAESARALAAAERSTR